MLKETSIQNIPNEIFGSILENIPFYEKVVVLPNVCKKWNSFIFKKLIWTKPCIEEIAKKALAKNESDVNVDEFLKQLDVNFLSPLKYLTEPTFKHHFTYNMGVPYEPQNENKIVKIYTHLQTGFSPLFNVNWTPSKTNFSIDNAWKWNNLSSLFSIKIDLKNYIANNAIAQRIVTLGNHSLNSVKRAGLLSWSSISPTKYESKLKLIGAHIDYHLDTYIEGCARYNVFLLSQMKTIENINQDVFFICDERGVIQVDKPVEHTFILRFSELDLKSDGTVKTILWEAPGLKESQPQSLIEMMRWAVFTRTTDLLCQLIKFPTFSNPGSKVA